MALSENVESKGHSINIISMNDAYQIKEHIIIDQESFVNTSFYRFHLPANVISNKNVIIIVNDTQITNPMIIDNIYQINLSQPSVDSMISIDITYYLSLSITYFEKTLLHNTSDFRIKFDTTILYENNMQQKDSFIRLRLMERIQPDSYNLYTIILIVLLLVIIIVTSYYAFIKRKNVTDRNRNLESSELLEIEKTLLLNMLKEIEKLHRNQKISDDSYHKLKSYYKQQTIDIMSNLDEGN
jgi:hypothetical protein